MPAKASDQDAKHLPLEDAKVLLLDPGMAGKEPTKDRLIEVGLRHITPCENLAALKQQLEGGCPDLLLLDLDSERDAVCTLMQDVRTSTFETENPFVVIIALTAKPDKTIVQTALKAGADDMIVKPVTSKALRDRVNRQIEERKDFIATEDYVGPDRRPEEREPSDENLLAIKVPNSLRHVVTGDEEAALSDERIQETLRSLSAQKFYHLSLKIGQLAGEAEEALEESGDFPLLGDCVEVISGTLGEIEEIMSDQDFKSVRGVVASTKDTLNGIREAGASLSPRHFGLLKVHGQSIGAVLKESDEVSGVLITELERAVQVVVGEGTDGGGPRTLHFVSKDEETEEAEKSDKVPFKIRFLAWWEGVSPDEILAAKQPE